MTFAGSAPLRILVTGSREFTDEDIVRGAIIETLMCRGRSAQATLLAHGAARGADMLADRVARSMNMAVVQYPADWRRYGRRAGYVRNAEMLENANPEVALAFFKLGAENKGTAMMVKLCKDRGVPVTEYWQEER